LVEGIAVPTSVLEAIKVGVWDFEPQEDVQQTFHATSALPGTDEKLAVLAERVRMGLPLWHPSDRVQYDDEEDYS
jgi:hypothetical protein